MKLRNKLIATIVSISMVLAVIGVGAWASTESFTATITNTVSLEFDNIKGQISVIGMSGADNLEGEAPMMQEVLYDGSNVIYNQISSSATNGTNLYWDGTMFMDGSDDGLGMINARTEAAALMYAIAYEPTEDCVGISTITAMVTETRLPEISGGNLLVRYFATTDGTAFTEIGSGEAITPIYDNEMLLIVAVCQYYNKSGASITTLASAWDFEVVLSAGSAEKTELTGSYILSPNMEAGVVLPEDYQNGVVPVLAINSAAGIEVDGLDGKVSVVGMSGADNLEAEDEPYMADTVMYDGSNLLYGQISATGMRGPVIYWEGARFLDRSAQGPQLVNDETVAAVFGYGFTYMPTQNCTGAKNVTITINEASKPVVSGGQLIVEYYVSTDGEYWTELHDGVNVTPIADNEIAMVGAICQYYNLESEMISTIVSTWDFSVSFTAGTTQKTALDGRTLIDLSNGSSGVVLPYDYRSAQEEQWEMIEFGEYPQSLKSADVNIVSENPDEDGYYLGSDGERYLKYTLDFHEWLAESFSQYGMLTADNGIVMQNEETYYFKVEPIKWWVLNDAGDKKLVVSEMLLDVSALSDDIDYSASYARNFFNGDFYDTAFSVAEQNQILITDVDNSLALDGSERVLIDNPYDHANTQDKVFALGANDVMNAQFGFNSSAKVVDPLRRWGVTDYAKARGVATITMQVVRETTDSYDRALSLQCMGSGYMWMRTVGIRNFGWESDDANTAVWMGQVFEDGDVLDKGLAPAMYISK